MKTISACTLVRNAVKLKYPLEASILSYYPLCDEVVIAYDPKSEDETEAYVQKLAQHYPRIKLIPSPWDMANHAGGTEITIQSNVAAEACRSDWVLYVQADEAIHEGDHSAIRRMVERDDLNGVLFDRASFMGTLDREIPEYYAECLLRLYRNGQGLVVGDGMTCGLYQGVPHRFAHERYRMFNYSRMGTRDEILLRSRCRDNFHISSEAAIEENLKLEFKQGSRGFDPEGHPAAIRRHYAEFAGSGEPPAALDCEIALALLVGNGECENLASFFWQFRSWPGQILVLDDMTEDGASGVLTQVLTRVLRLPPERLTVIRTPLGGDFAAARNKLQEAARAPWILVSAPDERWDTELLRALPNLAAQLERDGKIICGFPRANFVDGVLVNDVPDSEWTEDGLAQAVLRTSWPPRNRDVQYRLIRKEERWEGKIHEHPVRLSTRPQDVVVLHDSWILHNKTLSRQRKQDGFYRSLGQRRGMPQPAPARLDPPAPNLREATLAEVVTRMPPGKLVIVETGTLRDANSSARQSDGWSTYKFAELLRDRNADGSRLYSIDISPPCIETSKRVVPKELHPWVTWICGDSVAALGALAEDSIDLLYLDSSDDPRQILAEFETALPQLRPHSVVIVDDTGPYHAGPDGKGTLVLPVLRERGWNLDRRDNERCHMTIATQSAALVGNPT